MQALRELVLLIKQFGPAHRNLEASLHNSPKLGLFYEGVASGQFKTDEEASLALYGENPNGSKYRKLKADLREKLLDTILKGDLLHENASDYQKAYQECHKEWLTVRILTGHNANTSALMLASRLLRRAEKYEFTLLCMDVVSYLRIQYSLRESDDRKFQEANRRFAHYRAVYQAESLAEELYTDLVVRYVNNRSAKGNLLDKTEEYYSRVAPFLQQYDTYRLHMYGSLIGMMRFTAVNDYQETLKSCEYAICFFESKPYEARVPLQIFYYQSLICHIQLRHFEAGRDAARKCMSLMNEGTFNWFKFLELYLQLSLHTQKYQEAAQIFFSTLNHPRFEFLPENAQELWRINEPYIFYLGALGKLDLPAKHTFRLSRFLNETPIFSKDRSGLNICIITIRFLLFLTEKRFDKLLDEVEALEQYAYRHLRGKYTQRSYYFIRMLLAIPLSAFDPETIQKKSERFLTKLQNIPIQIASQSHELEVIPYEDLWGLALESLAFPSVKTKKRLS